VSNIIPVNFGALPAEYAAEARAESELGAGVSSGFAVLSYRNGRWHTKYRGEEKLLTNDQGDPRLSIEVVIIKAASAVAKTFYKDGYKEGSAEAPDCASTNGVTPDIGVKAKQCNTCAACPNNAWGSRVTSSGKAGKACSDNKRAVVVPLGDLENELLGGPMMLRIPAASLNEAASYETRMKALGFPVHMIGTRVSFDTSVNYPKMLFREIRALAKWEIDRIKEYRNDPRVIRILSEGDGVATPIAGPNFEQPAPAPKPKPAHVAAAPLPAHDPETGEVTPEVTPAPRRAPAKKPEPAPVAAAPEETASTGTSFDDELDAQMEALMPKR
jgi:hypothetical protein